MLHLLRMRESKMSPACEAIAIFVQNIKEMEQFHASRRGRISILETILLRNKYNLNRMWYTMQYVFSKIEFFFKRAKWRIRYIIIYLLYAITLILACEFWVGVPLSWWMMHQNSCLAQLCNHHQNLSVFSLHPHLLFVQNMVHLNMEDPIKKSLKI